jgi:hypothetical protein
VRKGTKLLLGAATGGALLVGGVLWSGSADAQGWGGRGGMGHAGMMLDLLDADGDGRITREELESWRAERLRTYDEAGDGQLSLDEFAGLWAEITRPMMVRAFQMLDRDGDGQVTEAELARATDRMFSRLDRTGDGVIEEGDLERRRGPRHEGRGPRGGGD